MNFHRLNRCNLFSRLFYSLKIGNHRKTELGSALPEGGRSNGAGDTGSLQRCYSQKTPGCRIRTSPNGHRILPYLGSENLLCQPSDQDLSLDTRNCGGGNFKRCRQVLKIHIISAVTLVSTAWSFLIPLSKQAGVVFRGARSIFAMPTDVKSKSLVLVPLPCLFGVAPKLELDWALRAMLFPTNPCALIIFIMLRNEKLKKAPSGESTFRGHEGYAYTSDIKAEQSIPEMMTAIDPN